jgi:hypothetical protein
VTQFGLCHDSAAYLTIYRTTPSLTHRRVTGSVGMDIRSRTSFSSIEHSRNHESVQELPAYGSDQALPCLWHEGLYGRSARLESVVLQLSTNLGSRNTISVTDRVSRHIRSPEAPSSGVQPSRRGVVGDVEMQCLMTATACGGVDRALTPRGSDLRWDKVMMRSHRGRLSSLREGVSQVK